MNSSGGENLLLEAPSNLGLRPRGEGTVPGCYKLPWALRDLGLLWALRPRNAGAVVPPKYRAAWVPGEDDRNDNAIAAYSTRRADRDAFAADVLTTVTRNTDAAGSTWISMVDTAEMPAADVPSRTGKKVSPSDT